MPGGNEQDLPLSTLILRVGAKMHELYPDADWTEVSPQLESLWREHVVQPDWSLVVNRLHRAWDALEHSHDFKHFR